MGYSSVDLRHLLRFVSAKHGVGLSIAKDAGVGALTAFVKMVAVPLIDFLLIVRHSTLRYA